MTRDAEMRYKVIDDSQSGHCCFSATVVDTTRIWRRDDDGMPTFASVCESFDYEDAVQIADALNKAEDLLGKAQMKDEYQLPYKELADIFSDVKPLLREDGSMVYRIYMGQPQMAVVIKALRLAEDSQRIYQTFEVGRP